MASIWRDAPNAILVLAADGALTAVLVVAYVLLGGATRRGAEPCGPTAASGGAAEGRVATGGSSSPVDP